MPYLRVSWCISVTRRLLEWISWGQGRELLFYRLRPRPQLEAGLGTCRSAVVLAFYKWCLRGSRDPGEQTYGGLLGIGCGSVLSVAMSCLTLSSLPPSVDLCSSVCSGVIIKPLSSKD